MKKLLSILTMSILMLMLNHQDTNAQARIGFSKAEIRSEFSNPIYNLKSGTTEKGKQFIGITTTDSYTFYYFDNTGYCNISVIIPKNQQVLNKLVQTYNNNYSITSNISWTAYIDGGVLHVSLQFFKEGGYAFYWHE